MMGKDSEKRGVMVSLDELEVYDFADGLSRSGSSKVTPELRRLPSEVLLCCDMCEMKEEKVGASSRAAMCAQKGSEGTSLLNNKPDLAMAFS
jgi:hypothetical protein